MGKALDVFPEALDQRDQIVQLERRGDTWTFSSARYGEPFVTQTLTGLDLGEASSGLVGRAHMVYDLWGDAVNLAFRLQAERVESDLHALFAMARVEDEHGKLYAHATTTCLVFDLPRTVA